MHNIITVIPSITSIPAIVINPIAGVKGDTGLTGNPGATGNTGSYALPRVQVVASADTITPNTDIADVVDVSALAVNTIFNNAIGTPANFQKLIIRLKDNGSARTISWDTIYSSSGALLPSTTTASKVLTLGFIYNSGVTKWQLIGSSLEV